MRGLTTKVELFIMMILSQRGHWCNGVLMCGRVGYRTDLEISISIPGFIYMGFCGRTICLRLPADSMLYSRLCMMAFT